MTFKPPEPDPEKTFLLNPDYYIVTGQKRNRIGVRTHHYLALLAIVISALAAYWATSQWIARTRRSDELNRVAVSIRARVIGKRFEDTGRTVSDRYFVTYRFTVEGQDYEREVEIDGAGYERAQVDGEIIVKYLPGDPATSTLYERDIAPANTDFLLIIALGPALITIPILFVTLLHTVRNMRYERRGRPIQGEVIASTGEDIAGRYYVTIRYRFRTPGDKQREGKRVRVRDDLRGQPLPKPGDPVAVLYVSDRMYRLL